MDGLNNRHFFSQFQKPGSPRPRCQPGQALGRPLFWAGRRPPSHCVFTWSRGKTLPFLVCLAAQSHPTLCDPVDCSPPGSSVHGTLQARILEWAATSFSRGASPPRIEPGSLASPPLAGGFFTAAPPGKPTDVLSFPPGGYA